MEAKKSASKIYPEVANSVLSSVSGYWRNKDFSDNESYASVNVSDSIDGKPDVDGFMDYLCLKGDDIRDVNTMGKWSVVPQTVDEIMGIEGFSKQLSTETIQPKPPSNPVEPPTLSPASITLEAQSIPIREELLPPSIQKSDKPRPVRLETPTSTITSTPPTSTISVGGSFGGGSGYTPYQYVPPFELGYEQIRERVMQNFK